MQIVTFSANSPVNRVERVIDSCETIVQFMAACKYIELAMKINFITWAEFIDLEVYALKHLNIINPKN